MHLRLFTPCTRTIGRADFSRPRISRLAKLNQRRLLIRTEIAKINHGFSIVFLRQALEYRNRPILDPEHKLRGARLRRRPLLALVIKDAKAQCSHMLRQQLGLPRLAEVVCLQYLCVTCGYTRVDLLLQHITREDKFFDVGY